MVKPNEQKINVKYKNIYSDYNAINQNKFNSRSDWLFRFFTKIQEFKNTW